MLKIHTFEMQKPINSNDERMRLQENLKGIQVDILPKKTYTRFRYYGLAKRGIIISVFLYRYTRCHKVCLQINPSAVLQIQEEAILFDVTAENFLQCLQRVGEILRRYHLDMCEYRISRVDFTQDIRFARSEVIDIVIQLLKRTGAPRLYRDKKYGDNIYKDSYNIEDCEGSEIVVYNKERQYAEREGDQCARMKGVMRVEVRIKMSDQGSPIFVQNAVCFPYLLEARNHAEVKIRCVFATGFYIKVKKVKEILIKEYKRKESSKRKRNKLEKMMKLTESVAVHQSLSKCIKGEKALFGYETTKDIIQQLAERRINLVSISAREPFMVIPDMHYMLGMKPEDEVSKDNRFLAENHLLDKLPVYELL